tara:strand:+ start:197 stop:475 length:279 start_codon:yes stop_codon:yes gene_type:complete
MDKEMEELIRGKWTDKDAIMLEISDKVYELVDLRELDYRQTVLTLIETMFMVDDISEVMLNKSLMNDSVKTLLWRDYHDIVEEQRIQDTEFE